MWKCKYCGHISPGSAFVGGGICTSCGKPHDIERYNGTDYYSSVRVVL